jgi:hypothetical protein
VGLERVRHSEGLEVIYVGLDPGSKSFGYAYWAPCKVPVCGSFRPKNMRDAAKRILEVLPAIALGQDFCVTIESQQHRGKNEKGSVNNILLLQTYTGIAVGVLSLLPGMKQCLLPTPQQWKNNIAKAVHTPILRKRYGPQPILGPKGGQGDALDAFGLLMWGHDQIELLGKYS